MSRPTFFATLVGAALLATTLGAPVSAQRLDNLTYLTFSSPVRVPGAVLNAGTYRFHLADADSGRHVVQVMSNDGVIVYSMFHTMPDYRTAVTRESTVTFREAPAGVPVPVKSLFYGGEQLGYEFLYARGELPAFWPIGPEAALAPAPIVTEATPMVEERHAAATPDTAVIESAPAEPVATEPPAAEPVAGEPAPALPATGSPLPLVALGGLAFLVLGLGVGWFRRVA